MSEHHKIIIIGAGLSGLYTAWRLQQEEDNKPEDIVILESRDRIGGRILSVEPNDVGRVGSDQMKTGRVDMGPAWIWPDLQPRLQKLITELEVKTFKQFTTGDKLFEKSSTDIERYSSESAHSQSYRITDGSQSLIDALQRNITKTNIHLNTCVQSIQQHDLSIRTLRDGKPCQYRADKIILALPPRLIDQHISFEPPLPATVTNAWREIPTWMSAHSKIVFIYEKAFWREQNLSGEVFSQHGPLSEIYDGSPIDEEFYALTAFVGLNAHQRTQISQQQLIDACMAQLQRLFGVSSKNVVDIIIKDWSQDKSTSTERDLSASMQHPHYAANLPRSFWNDQLLLAGTEVAHEHGGYLEGALESADKILTLLTDQTS
jgi:monoamine oxidase